MVRCILIYVVSVFISSVAQMLLKKSAQKTHSTVIKEYLNPYVISAYAIFLISTMLTVLALKEVPLSTAPAIESLGYVFVAVLGYCVIHERIGRRKLAGILLIIVGICVACI